jgi:hypothetical protein
MSDEQGRRCMGPCGKTYPYGSLRVRANGWYCQDCNATHGSSEGPPLPADRALLGLDRSDFIAPARRVPTAQYRVPIFDRELNARVYAYGADGRELRFRTMEEAAATVHPLVGHGKRWPSVYGIEVAPAGEPAVVLTPKERTTFRRLGGERRTFRRLAGGSGRAAKRQNV